ncbi:transcriptional regulator GutM [Pelosinus sp. IPA-1]|uniref:transcriptional regulator GutM n=1 Tax=Pelosinus sp. IPA-1 TaxID=3029569 RepID=UPI0024361DBB|nr:transcriptional regulator GutM [Pelosinus sp. IPA-1]GMA98831.1 glucitol operon activator protein [Pelosinus sp. IPA-1]
MEYMWTAAGVWLLQGVLGVWQTRHFNQGFKQLRKEGRVVVGKSKGRMSAGVVVMFCLATDGKIIRGEKMAGVTSFARLKPFSVFNHWDLLELTPSACGGLDNATRKAVLQAVKNYQEFRK